MTQENKKLKTINDYAQEVMNKWIDGGRMKDIIKQAMEDLVDSAPDPYQEFIDLGECDETVVSHWKKDMKGES